MFWLKTHFIWFTLYAVIGWVWEVVICSIPAKRFINRGFLNGPYCPIYGTGAIIVIVSLSGIANPVLLFFIGAILTCTLEYITSWAMEKLFHAKWWDYSDKFLNINGRVCLLGAVAFGALSVVTVKLLHPVMAMLTLKLPDLAISIISLSLFALLLTDTVYTLTSFSDFNAKLHELNERLNNALSLANGQRKAISEKIHSNEIYMRITELYVGRHKRINSQERRLIKAFPKLRSTRYNDALDRIRQHIFTKSANGNASDRTDANINSDE